MSKKLIVGVAVIVLVLVFIGYQYWNKQTKSPVVDVTAKINAVWAVQGPFKNGTESATALRFAAKAVGGPDSLYSVIDKHAVAYEAHPERWEEIRKKCLIYANGQEYETNLESAKRLGAVVNPNNAAPPAR